MQGSVNNRIGGSPNCIEDEFFLKGQGRFVSDIIMPRMVHAEFLRSVYANARIVNVDCSEARAMPGVLVILTGEDCRTESLGSIRPFAVLQREDGSKMFVPENLPLTDKRVVFSGDPIAVVIAETKLQAVMASEVINTEFEEYEATIDIATSLKPGAPLVWPESETNECFFWSKGDLEKVTKQIIEADHVVKRKFTIPLAAANPIEPRGCIAEYDSVSKRFHLTAPVQSPWKVRQILATQSLKILETSLTVSCPDIGGSFGMKGQTYNEYAVCLWAAQKLGRPVKWIASRSESLLADDQGRNVIVEASLSLNSDGKFLGLYVSGLCGLGAYLSTRGTKTSIDNWPGVSGVYEFESVYSEMRGVFTNTGSVSPYRGAGRPEAAYVIERLVDIAANQVQISPAKLRELNFIKSEDMPYLTKLGFIYDSGDYKASLSKAMDLSDWRLFNQRKEKSRRNGFLRGRGIACVVERSMSGQPEYASIRIDTKGIVTLSCGAISFGQGSSTIFPQILREKMGIDELEVKYVNGDTRLVPKGTGSFGSRSAGIAGAAVALAVHNLIEEGKQRASRLLQEKKENIAYSSGEFRGFGGGSVSLFELATNSDLFSEAEYEAEESTFPSGTHISEVEVDLDTGAVSLVSYCVVEDTGTVVNPIRLDGQMHGGVAQGAGQTLMEVMKYDSLSGQLLTGSFMDYAMPRATDFPFFKVDHNANPSPVNPLGIKGGGEGGTVGALVCVANAIADCLIDKTTKEIPIPASPSAIWEFLNSTK